MIRNSFSILALLLLITACSKKTAVVKPTMEVQTPDTVKTDPAFRPAETADFTIDSARVSARAGLLYVYVSYSGGCREHRFEAITDGAWGKSLPPQINVFLRHDNSGDACREAINKTLVYDVKGIRHPTAKEIQLNIGTFKLKYTPQ